jgi:RNA polymerase-binding protein DksA
MRKTDLEQFKRQLLALRTRFNKDVSQLADEALRKSQDHTGNLSSMPIHMADIGSENYEQELSLSLLENEEEALAQIERALARIDKGTYGTCEECGTEIPKERLKAIPYTRHCVECARKLEKRS